MEKGRISMAEFLSQYGSLLLIGAFALVMFRMHSRGGGCCGGGHRMEHDSEEDHQAHNKDQSCH